MLRTLSSSCSLVLWYLMSMNYKANVELHNAPNEWYSCNTNSSRQNCIQTQVNKG